MNTVYKKIVSLTVILCFYVLGAYAQQNHFIYVQTESKQPFYIKHNKKLLSSSVTGYLIIPKLQDGNYTLTIGFPKSEWPEQNITCSINNNDAGYVLKNFGEKGWGLFNLQTFDIVMAAKKSDAIIAAADEKVNVPDEKPVVTQTVPEKSIVPLEEKPAVVEIAAEKKMDTLPAIVKIIEEKTEHKEQAKPLIELIKKEEPVVTYTPEQIKKVFNSKNNEGREMIFVNTVNGKPDTIIVFIPALKKNENVQAENKELDTELLIKPSLVKPTVTATEPKFIDIEKQNPNLKPDSSTIKSVGDTAKAIFIEQVKPTENLRPQLSNSDCKNHATEDDFLKLRKKMAAEDNDAGMIDGAKKVFRSRCFTTEQVKNLSVLFLKNEGKYKFFDIAYPYVSDAYNFTTLQTQLSDEYFINRFKAMLRH